ncbi:MAG: flagellar biosynthetic protein FliQ [Proteobacteria bacterium]|nr:flagellar biosynthetic protein FliQ [Pseudomonadota bacterium]
MDSSIVMDIAIESLVVTIKVALPVLAGALSAGVVVGVLQAATSIQEMTLSFIPKLAVMAIMLALFGEWQLNVLMEFFDAIFERVRNLEA